ncbi:MAG: MBL fold metallo-hydrolase [Caldilineaceae bacterium]|nr:MBL fold metallo-hydrolase [Caldilineaceae bacterium]
MSEQGTLPSAHHFQLQAIAEGVFVALAKPESGAGCNAGIIDLGDQTLIFDPFLTPQAATELRAIAESISTSPVKMVINSHYHLDHIGGNQVFPETTTIVTTSTARSLMLSQTAQKLATYQAHANQRLAELEQQVSTLRKPAEKQEAQQLLAQWQFLHQALPSWQIRLPTMTFDQRLVLYGSQRQVELLTYGGGHSQSDAILYLPTEQIVFMGDLISVQSHPALSDGDPGELPRILDLINRLQPQKLVPGHGPVGTAADLQVMQKYLATMTEMALTELAFQTEEGADIDKRIAHLRQPIAYTAWVRPRFFADNLRFLYQRVMTAYAE